MQVLVIGGTGFIGAHLLRQLVEKGHDVAVFHRGQTNAPLPDPVHNIIGDRKELSSFATDFKRFAPAVVLDMIPYEEEDALVLMDTFRGLAQRVIAISSMDVYAAYGRFRRNESGEPESKPFSEDAPSRSALYPYRNLAQSANEMLYRYDKILVERVVMSDHHLPGTVLRLPYVYGDGDKYHRTFEYVKRMDDGRHVILLDERKAQWRWTRGYVENVAAAIALAVTDERAANRIYNVGEAEALTEAEWVESIGRAAGWEGRVVAVPKESMPKHLVEEYDWRHHLAGDTSRIREEYGYSEPVLSEEALRRTVAWDRSNPPEEVNTERFDYAAEDAVLKRVEETR